MSSSKNQRLSRIPKRDEGRQTIAGPSNFRGSNVRSTSRSVDRLAAPRFTLGTPQTPRCKSPVLETRSLNDKNWQREKMRKIQEFLQDHQLNINVKPPIAINSFIAVTNKIFSCIDDGIVLDLTNYKTKAVEILLDLGYPTKSLHGFFKNVNAPHNFPNILGVWAFLLDLVDEKAIIGTNNGFYTALGLPENGRAIKECILNHYNKMLVPFNNGEECPLTGFEEEIVDLYSCADDVIGPKEQELNDLIQKGNHLNENKKLLQSELEEVESKTGKYEQSIENYKTELAKEQASLKENLKKINSAAEYLDESLVQIKAKITDTDEKISEIGCSRNDVEEMIREIDSRQHSIGLCQERIKHCMEQISDTDLKLAELRKNIETSVNNINNIILDCACIIKNVDSYLLLESGFASSTYIESLESIWNNDAFLKKFDEHVKIIEDTKCDALNTNKLLRNKCSEKNAEKERTLQELNKLKEKEVLGDQLQLECDKSEEKLMKIKSEITTIIESTPDLRRYQELMIKANERRLCLENYLDNQNRKILELLENSNQIICDESGDLLAFLYDEITKRESQKNTLLELIERMKQKMLQFTKEFQNANKPTS